MINIFNIRNLIVSILFLVSIHVSGQTVRDMNVPESLMSRLKSFEPSGSLYLADLNRFLIISDDTNKKDSPYVFLMDESGQVEAQPILIQNLQGMTDMESVSVDQDGMLYFMSSLGVNKNGSTRKVRNLFVSAKRQVREIKAVDSIDLRKELIKKINSSSIPELKNIKSHTRSDLDIESSFVRDGELFVGLKNPQLTKSRALILNLGSVKHLFKHNEIESLSIWRVIDFDSLSGNENLISDMLVVGEHLYMTSTSEIGDGAFWKLNLVSQKLTLLKEFKALKPEGLSYRPQTNELLVVFDRGLELGQYMFFPGVF